MSQPAESRAVGWAAWRTTILAAGLVALVALIAWPSFVGRIQYARTRAELAAIADAAAGARLAPVAKLFTTPPSTATRPAASPTSRWAPA